MSNRVTDNQSHDTHAIVYLCTSKAEILSNWDAVSRKCKDDLSAPHLWR